jgi:hypothetical protein
MHQQTRWQSKHSQKNKILYRSDAKSMQLPNQPVPELITNNIKQQFQTADNAKPKPQSVPTTVSRTLPP